MFGGGFGLMQGGNYSGPVGVARARDPRYAYALALAKNAGDTSPIQSPWQGVNRMAQGALSGYMLGSTEAKYKAEEDAYTQAVAKALKQMGGTPAVTQTSEDQSAYGGEGPQTTITSPAIPADVQGGLATLAGNKYAAPMASQFQMQQIAAQSAAQQAAAAQANQPYTLSPGQQRVGLGGQVLAQVPATPERPQTVNTQDGVFILNRDGSLGQRLGGPSSLVTMNLPPSGYQPRPGAGGTPGMTHIPGGPADPAVIRSQAEARAAAQPPQPMTQDQANAALFADRMAASNAILAQTEQQGLNPLAPALGKISVIGNALQSEEYQKFEQAKRDFINATLRKESGATITPEEFGNAEKQYFPQPGDKPEVIAQKRANRETALQSFQRTAGPQYTPKEIRDAPKAEEIKNIGGKEYVKIGGKWYEK